MMFAPQSPVITIIGGCQVTGLAAATRALLPEATVIAFHVGADQASSVANVAAALDGSDLVLSQFDETDARQSLRPNTIRARGLKLISIPVMVFPGFHPDMIYIVWGNGSLLRCQQSDYHSRITAAGFRLGLGQEQVFRLFNGYVFAALRYYDVFDAASVVLIEQFQKFGYDLRHLMPRWIAHSGAFMHTINHPKVVVLADLCTVALKKAGFVADTALLASQPEDNLENDFVGAIFSQVARRAGVEASGAYQRAISVLQPGQSRQISLRDHIAASYAGYRNLPPDFAWPSEVEAASDVIRSLLVAPNSRPRPSIQLLLEAARVASNTSNSAEAALLWGDLVALQPDLAESHIKLGDSLRELGDWARCEVVCTEAWNRFPDDMWVGRNWALSAHYAGNIAEAVRRYTQVATHHRHDLIAADLADCMLIIGDLDGAEAVLRNALNYVPDSHWLRATTQRLRALRSSMV